MLVYISVIVKIDNPLYPSMKQFVICKEDTHMKNYPLTTHSVSPPSSSLSHCPI